MSKKPAGSISLLAPAISTKNYFETARTNVQDALTLVQGMTAGNIITLTAPLVQLLQPKYGDDKGRAMIEANLAFVYDQGDDEMSLAFT